MTERSGAERVMAQASPLVLILSEDLFFLPRLQDALGQLGYRVKTVDSPEKVGAAGPPVSRDIPLTEPLDGADAALMRSLTADRPVLILVDLTTQGVPWARWIQVLKTSAATRRIPIVAFGPHVDVNDFEQARRAGADRVLPRGQISRELPELVEVLARAPDAQALSATCQDPLSELALEGIRLHNAGAYFEAHELLEEAWMEEEGEAGYLYRALLQVAVTHLHMVRGNLRGAQKMMLRIRQWLDPLPDRCRGVDVDQLRSYVHDLRQELESMSQGDLEVLDLSRLASIHVAS